VDDPDIRPKLLCPSSEAVAVEEARHDDVRDEHAKRQALFQQDERDIAVDRRQGIVARILQGKDRDIEDVLLVIDKQYFRTPHVTTMNVLARRQMAQPSGRTSPSFVRRSYGGPRPSP